MKILIACEESQTITKEYRKLGIEAYSCDILDCSGGHPEWHIKGDAIKEAYSGKYDLMIAHPPCTYLAVSGARWLYNKDGTKNKNRWDNRELALDFVRKLMKAPIKKIALENPISCISSQIRKPDQIIQPYMFGDKATKSTCLWLKNLPLLKPTNIVEKGETITFASGKKMQKWYSDSFGKSKEERQKLRSKTFKGIAEAIATQWI
jgi:site-specific DNA-cytosine methylase|tara:strand:+ start:109 stop:726 length:618 start_codon:yes stop_codon:yes gene_type:complete